MPVIIATDFIVFLVAGALVWFVVGARMGGGLNTVWQSLARNRLAVVSMVFLAAYLAVAFMDSVRWRDAVATEKGAAMLAAGGKAVYSAEALSLLDRAFSGARLNIEKTYSAPFAGRLHSKETIELAGGGAVRDYPRLKFPGRHWLGTDKVGGDVFLASLKGVRTAVVIGTGTTIVIIPFALFFGVVAGFFGGVLDDIIQYVYTTLSSIPGVLLIVAFMLLFGTTGYQGGLISDSYVHLRVFVLNDRLFWLCLILGITSWTDLCRLVRGETLKLRELEYVQAARAFGVSNAGIIVRHIVPNVMHLILITFVLQFSGLVLAEAVLSYIGIGVGPEMGSWGNMINTARLELSRDPVVWWNLLGAFIFMFALVLPANLFADAVRDALDPRMRYRR
ncbi:MAG: ABC transporter permease [Deltaproteobacteria bacterium]|nr:ABC transporter permease [Deltaproteobacteria bacterium]